MTMTLPTESIDISQARRLALAGAGLLAPRRLGLPDRAGARHREALERFSASVGLRPCDPARSA